MSALNKVLSRIEVAFTQGQHVHITEQHLAEFGLAHSEELMREFEELAARVGCNFSIGREDGTWIRAGGVAAKEGEKGYVFYQNAISVAGMSCIEDRFILKDHINKLCVKKWGNAEPVGNPKSHDELMAGIDRRAICGALAPFQQWAKLNLGFHLHQADAAESAIFDGKRVVVEDGIWLIKWEKEPHQEIASVAEYGMWKTLQEWWDVMGKMQAMIPTRAR